MTERRPRSAVPVAVAGSLAVLIGAGAYYTGAFTGDGRFTEPVHACDLAEPADLTAMLNAPRRNAEDSRPSRTWLEFGSGDRRAQCKWDRTRKGSPLEAVVIRVDQRVEDAPSVSAPERAHEEFVREQRFRRGGTALAGLGEEADTRVDVSTARILWVRSKTEDVHVRYRVSNVVVDISGRLEEAGRGSARKALIAFAHRTATALDRLAA